jgi:hypothetical protein
MDIKIIEGIVTNSYVVHGASLKCTLGLKTAKLLTPVGHGVFIRGKKQANVLDMIPIINISSFSGCMITSPPTPCAPAIAPCWLNGKADVIIGNAQALVKSSIGICLRGGVITIIDDGQ